MMISNKIYIYGLFGNDNIIRYIGKSINPNKRLKEHISESKKIRSNYHKNNWIKKILKNGENLNFIVLDECNEENWIEKEKYWIKQYENLTNISDGGDGRSGKHFNLPLNDIIDWVKTNLPEINSWPKWRKYVKNNTIPDFIPKRPDYVYKNNEWISFNHFFGYPNHNKIFLPYDDLKKIINYKKIKTSTEYRKNREKNMPYSPEVYYKNNWISWEDFLGREKKINKKIVKIKNKFMNFNDAKEIIKPLNFTKKIEYTKWLQLNKNINLPVNPKGHYKNVWVSYTDFFGNNLPRIILYHKKTKNENFLLYNNAKEWINKNYPQLKGERNWRKITENLPYFIPKRPDHVYKNNGWLGWKIFLNYYGYKTNFFSYNELKKIVNENNIKTYKEYLAFKKHNMPVNPYMFYKDKWISWKCFLNK